MEPQDACILEYETASFLCNNTATNHTPSWKINGSHPRNIMELRQSDPKYSFSDKALHYRDCRLINDKTTYQCIFLNDGSQSDIATLHVKGKNKLCT